MEENTEPMLRAESEEMSSEKEQKPSSMEEEKKETSAEADDGLFSGKAVAILCLIYVVYICVGGVIFHFIETPTETTAVNDSVAKLINFLQNNTCVSQEDLAVFVQDVIEAYDAGITLSNDTESHDTSWDIVSSIFFCTTIVSTIGYGNIAPSGPGGRVFAVFFALFGIPLFVIVSGQLGMRFSRTCNKITAKAVKNVKNEKWRPTISLFIIFIIGFTLFMIISAVIFFVTEGWTYADSLYYTFITLTTIGLGDFVPGFANGLEQRSAGSIFYRLFVSVWVIFGLVWMASTISAISDSLANFVNSRKTKPNYEEGSSESGESIPVKGDSTTKEDIGKENETKDSTNL